MVGRRISPPGRDIRHLPPVRMDQYAPAFVTHTERERMKREMRRPSPEIHRRSITPPSKRRHPPSPGFHGGSQMSRRRSFTPPPPTLRRSRSRTPPRKERPLSPRGVRRPEPEMRRESAVRRELEVRREPEVRRELDVRRDADGPGMEFTGPWGTRVAIKDLKKITVDIKRHLPKGKRSSSPIIRRIINADDIVLYRRSGEGSRPLFDRQDLRNAINRRFDDAPSTGTHEPRIVAILPEGEMTTVRRGAGGEGTVQRRSRSRERSYRASASRHPSVTVGERIDMERAERADRTQRQVEKLEQMEVAIDRKLEQIQRYERKYEEAMRNEKYGPSESERDVRKPVDRSVRDRLGPKRSREDGFSSDENLPDFSQRPNKPPVWGEERPVKREFYPPENRSAGFRGRGVFRGRPRGRGRGMSPTSWRHDKYEEGF